MRILIVEDDEALARAIVQLLREAGNAVDHVSTGEDALMVAADDAYALIVLDVGLPDLEGFAVLETIRRSGNRVPVLMLTARALDLRRREWAVLDALATRAGQIVSRVTLQSEVFGYDEPVGPNAIEVNIARLRTKLSSDGPVIRTIRGVGYMLDGD